MTRPRRRFVKPTRCGHCGGRALPHDTTVVWGFTVTVCWLCDGEFFEMLDKFTAQREGTLGKQRQIPQMVK